MSDWHDYEPNLEFDDTELTHAPDPSQIVLDDEDFVSGKLSAICVPTDNGAIWIDYSLVGSDKFLCATGQTFYIF